MAFGKCKLTGKQGTFVRSHLMPKALTKLSSSGEPYIESGLGLKPSRRMDSWYDAALVTRCGEDCLQAHDTWGIQALRRHRLVWSGWGDSTALDADLAEVGDHPVRIRTVAELDAGKLRLFLLSLLWRAGATTRSEFDLVAVSRPHLERLRQIVVGDEPDSPDFFPVTLTQFSTRGAHHNRTPITQINRFAGFEGLPDRESVCIRFYFDGLIAHFYQPAHFDVRDYLGTFCVSAGNPLLVTAIPFDGSRADRDIATVVRQSEYFWPGVAGRVGGR